jgi:hypothetical protein
MNKKNVVYTHNEVFFSHKEELNHLVAGIWMELEIIMLSKRSQTQKDKYHICSTQNLDLKNKMQ